MYVHTNTHLHLHTLLHMHIHTCMHNTCTPCTYMHSHLHTHNACRRQLSRWKKGSWFTISSGFQEWIHWIQAHAGKCCWRNGRLFVKPLRLWFVNAQLLHSFSLLHNYRQWAMSVPLIVYDRHTTCTLTIHVYHILLSADSISCHTLLFPFMCQFCVCLSRPPHPPMGCLHWSTESFIHLLQPLGKQGRWYVCIWSEYCLTMNCIFVSND